jgi:hypothetical protein
MHAVLLRLDSFKAKLNLGVRTPSLFLTGGSRSQDFLAEGRISQGCHPLQEYSLYLPQITKRLP